MLIWTQQTEYSKNQRDIDTGCSY